jgi:4-amino-4-deoxy-L-arabinose transferase-like glycosyltransferase
LQNRKAALFWPVVTILLAAMATLQWATVRQESQTSDEGRQLLSGYTYLTSGHFTVAIEHPPLLKLLWALPVWFLHPSAPHGGDAWLAAVDFLYHNRVSADAMLMAGRFSAIAVSVMLGLAIAFWARRHFGVGPALFAVFLFAADPNFLANGRYIKNDVGASLMIFAATMIWGDYLMHPTRKRLWLSGLVVGLALATKNSALILWPAMLLLYVLHRWQQRRPFAAMECVRSLGTAAIIAFAVIFLVYGFEVTPAGSSPQFAMRIFPAASWLKHVPVPALGYFRGIGNLGLRQAGSALEVSYLLGRQSASGWWYMTPVAFAVKTPLAELALFGMVLAVVARRLRTLRLREMDFRWLLFLVTPVCYLAAALLAHSNVGERHLLPLYPFLFVFSAGVLLAAPVPKWRWAGVAACGLLLIVETGFVHPHYLAFFNALAGGPAGGREYLVDSNLDWGQDVGNLKRYMDEHRIPGVCISYYGWADLDYYGIRHRELPDVRDSVTADQLDCVAAISATNLAVYPDRFAGLAQLEPDARIGYSIYVYDLRRRP